MNFWVSRGGQQYGPYSLADLQRYVTSGNIMPTDLARSESMNQWLPVSQILASGGAPPAQPAAPQPMAQQPQPQPQQPQPQQPQAPQPYYGQPDAPQQQPQPYAQPAAPQQAYGQAPVYSQPAGAMAQPPVAIQGGPLPPGMEWWLVLIIAIFTCGLFSLVWMFIQANFAKQLRPACQALTFYAIAIALYVATIGLFFMRSMVLLAPVLNIGFIVLIVLGHFQIKAALEDYYNTTEPINLRLNGVMVFFFNVFYFQYHLARIRKWKTTGVWTA